MSVPPQSGNGQIGGMGGLGQPPPPGPLADGLPPEIMQILMLLAQAAQQRQQGGVPPVGPPAPGPGALQGLFGGTPPPPMAGPEPGPTPGAPPAGIGAMAPQMPGPSLTGGIGIPEVDPSGGFAAFNQKRGLG